VCTYIQQAVPNSDLPARILYSVLRRQEEAFQIRTNFQFFLSNLVLRLSQIDLWMVTDVSEEHPASIFSVEHFTA
jgi:hypothetical protein